MMIRSLLVAMMFTLTSLAPLQAASPAKAVSAKVSKKEAKTQKKTAKKQARKNRKLAHNTKKAGKKSFSVKSKSCHNDCKCKRHRKCNHRCKCKCPKCLPLVFASRYNDSNVGEEQSSVCAGDNILFNQSYVSETGGISYDAESGVFSLPAGVYEVSYGVAFTGNAVQNGATPSLQIENDIVPGSRLFSDLESGVACIVVENDNTSLSVEIITNENNNGCFALPANAENGRNAYITIIRKGDVEN